MTCPLEALTFSTPPPVCHMQALLQARQPHGFCLNDAGFNQTSNNAGKKHMSLGHSARTESLEPLTLVVSTLAPF